MDGASLPSTGIYWLQQRKDDLWFKADFSLPASHTILRFQAFIVFKGNDTLKIHFRGWSNKWDEDIGQARFEYRLRPRIDSTAVGAERSFESFDDVANQYSCSKFRFCSLMEATTSPRDCSAESPDSNSTFSKECEEIDAFDEASDQW